MPDLSKDDKLMFENNFPANLFGCADDFYDLQMLRSWIKDFSSGLLMPRQGVLFLCILFAFAAEGCDPPRRDYINRYFLSLLLEDCVLGANLLPASLHACRTRDMLLNEQEFFQARSAHQWRTFLLLLPKRFYHNFDEFSCSFGRLNSPVFWGGLNKMRNAQTRLESNRRALAILRGIARWTGSRHHRDDFHRDPKYRTNLLWFIEQFGGLVPTALISHWKNSECSPIPESEASAMISVIEEALAQRPMELCKCDELMHLTPRPSTSIASAIRFNGGRRQTVAEGAPLPTATTKSSNSKRLLKPPRVTLSPKACQAIKPPVPCTKSARTAGNNSSSSSPLRSASSKRHPVTVAEPNSPATGTPATASSSKTKLTLSKIVGKRPWRQNMYA